MYSNYINDGNNFSNILLCYPSESIEEEQEFNLLNENIYNPPSPPESELGKFFIFEDPLEKPDKKPIFRTKKDGSKINKPEQKSNLVDIERIKNIEFNGVKPPLNQIFNLSKEVTKENSNINCAMIDKKKDIYIKKKRKRHETKKENDEKKNYKRQRPDNCRVMIGRNFFNFFLIKSIINSLIRNNGSNLYFERFPQKFILEATERKNKHYLDMTLEDLLTKKELYVEYPKKQNQFLQLKSIHEKGDKKALENFDHNYNALKKLKSDDDNNNILEKSGLNKYLQMTYKELYQEYSESYRYKKSAKLVESKANPDEFQKLSEYKTFIEFFEK